MAPEQHAGGEVTVRSDVYALGMGLYELFTGESVFGAGSPAELARRHRDEVPAPPARRVEGLEPAVNQAILRCLAKDPSERPASAEAVEAGLDRGFELATGTFLRTVVAGDLDGRAPGGTGPTSRSRWGP